MMKPPFTAEDKKNAVARYHKMMSDARVMHFEGMTSKEIEDKMVAEWAAEIKAEITAIIERN